MRSAAVFRKKVLNSARQPVDAEDAAVLPGLDLVAGPQRGHGLGARAGQQLRGCIGTLEACRPLAEDVSRNAWAAAFRDPRFPPLQESELAGLDIHISVLSEAEPVTFGSEQDLLGRIRPGVDGLILEERSARGTFLPSVWESLPEPEQFLAHLKLKAGLPADYWSASVRMWRYTTQSFGASVASIRGRQVTT